MRKPAERWRFVAAAALAAAGAWVATTAPAADWPQWRGPDRTDVTPEGSGWPKGWPPAKLWSRNVGRGCTSPILAGGRLYVMGWQGGRGSAGTDTLWCFEAAGGRVIWKQSYPCRYQSRLRTGDTGAYGGPSGTPTLETPTGRLYTLSVDGDLRCWDAHKGGKPIWGINLHDRFPIRRRPDAGRGTRDYGHTGSPLIYGDLVIVEVGSTEGTVMAFDKKTGRRRWASEFREPAGHSGGPVLFRVAGADCLANLALFRLVVMRLDAGREGKTLATCPWQTDFANNIPTPAAHGSRLVVTSSYNVSRTGLIEISPGAARRKWTTRQHAKVASPVIYKGRVFLVDGPCKCLDLATGRTIWRGGSFAHGSCLVAGDDKLLVFGRGQLVLLDALSGEGSYRELARVRGLVRGTCYPHVALGDGIVCCKDRDGAMVVLSVRGGRAAAAATAPPAPRPAKPQPDAPAPKLAGAWPGSFEGLVFVWEAAGRPNRIPPAGGRPARTCRLRRRGRAKTNARGEMDLAGGAMLAEGADEALLAACKASGRLSIEAVIRPANLTQAGPARIVSFSSDPYRRNFTVGQERDRLVLRLRTPHTGENGMRPETQLCRLRAGKAHHVIVSYSPGRLRCYLDGQRVLETDRVRGDFSNWSAQHLLFGDEWKEPRDWAGTLHHVALYRREIGPEEAARRYRLASGRP